MIVSDGTKINSDGEKIFILSNIQASILNWANANRTRFFNNRWEVTDATAYDHFWHDFREFIASSNVGKDKKDLIKGPSTEVLRSEWNICFNSVLPKIALGTLQNTLRFSGETDLYVNQLIEMMTGKVDVYDAAVLKQWVWQIKRKLFGLPVFDHIFLMLYEQLSGAGKSLMVSRICLPLDEWKLSVSLAYIADSRHYGHLENNFIVVLDEMTKPEKISADTLKQQITQEYNDYRPLYSNTTIKAKQNCSFIGTANKPLDALISDDTKMRRFYQIECVPMNIDALKVLDCLPLWKSIDENNNEGFFTATIREGVEKRQQQLSTPLPTDLWVKEMNLRPVDKKNVLLLPSNVLYKHFQEWANHYGYKIIPDCPRFAKAVKLEKGDIDRNTRGMFVNPDHILEKSQWRREIL